MECWLLTSLPINTLLLLVCHDFHFTNYYEPTISRIHNWHCGSCHTLGVIAFINDTIRLARLFGIKANVCVVVTYQARTVNPSVFFFQLCPSILQRILNTFWFSCELLLLIAHRNLCSPTLYPITGLF